MTLTYRKLVADNRISVTDVQHEIVYMQHVRHSAPSVHSRAESPSFSSSQIMTAPGQIGWMDVQIYGHGLDHYEILHRAFILS